MIYTTEQKRLIGALIGLCRTCDSTGLEITDVTYKIIIEGMNALRISENAEYSVLTEKAGREKFRLSPGCASCASPCGRNADYNMESLKSDIPEIQAEKLEILTLLTDLAVAIYPDMKISDIRGEVKHVFVKSLFAVGELFTYSELRELNDEINIYLSLYQG